MFISAGDFNHLNTQFLSTNFGFYQLVNTATHGNNLIDNMFVSHPDIYQCNVIKPLLKTKHVAVILCPANSGPIPTTTSRRKVSVFDLREPYIASLCYWYL